MNRGAGRHRARDAAGVEIAGPRLRLREMTENDAPGLLRVYGDRETTRHLAFGPRSLEPAPEV